MENRYSMMKAFGKARIEKCFQDLLCQAFNQEKWKLSNISEEESLAKSWLNARELEHVISRFNKGVELARDAKKHLVWAKMPKSILFGPISVLLSALPRSISIRACIFLILYKRAT
jgi:hypothetical protein